MLLRNRNQGLTLVELLMAIFVLVVGIMSALLFFSQSMIVTDFAGDITVASAHAEYIMEEIKSRKTLMNVTGTNWESWAAEQGLNTLPQETFQVSFGNVLDNPLDVETTVSWMRSSRVNKVSLVTKIAK